MAENSKIEWTNHTANLWWGCSRVHAGCDNCYSCPIATRYKFDIWGNDKPRRMIQSVWSDFKKFQKQAEKKNEIHKVFVGSMMDIFEKPMPIIDNDQKLLLERESEFWNTGQLRDKFFNEVVPNSPNLMFLLLTKRPSNINKYIPESWKENPPKNVMFGTSPVDQETADKLIIQLSKVKGRRFLSVEPQLESVNLMAKANDGTDRVLLDLIDWVINGGESGHGKRPFNTDWARIIRDDCKKKNIPFFFKQIDKIQAIPEDLMIREFPNNNNNNLNIYKMKKIFHYDTCEDAFEALNTTLNTDGDFDWESIQQVGFWLNEFIRDTNEDLNWLNIVINTIGHECSTIKYWFSLQSGDSESWTESSYELICLFAHSLND